MFFKYENYESKFMQKFYASGNRGRKGQIIITKDSGKSVVCDRVILEFYVEYFC